MSRCINVTFRKKQEINNATKSQFNGGLKESVQLQSETETIKFNRTFYLRALEKTRNKWPRFHGFRRFFSVPKMFLLPLSPFSCIFSISFFLFFFFFPHCIFFQRPGTSGTRGTIRFVAVVEASQKSLLYIHSSSVKPFRL